MKLELLMPLSGPNGTFEKGEEIAVADDAAALRYIEKGIAKFKNKKEHDAFLKKIDAIKEEQARRKAEAEALIKQEQLRAELNSLCAQVVIKAAEVNGVVLSDQQIVDGVEALLNEFLKERQDASKSNESFFGSLFFGKE